MQVCSQPRAQDLTEGFRPVTILRQLSEGARNKSRLDVRSAVVRSLFFLRERGLCIHYWHSPSNQNKSSKRTGTRRRLLCWTPGFALFSERLILDSFFSRPGIRADRGMHVNAAIERHCSTGSLHSCGLGIHPTFKQHALCAQDSSSIALELHVSYKHPFHSNPLRKETRDYTCERLVPKVLLPTLVLRNAQIDIVRYRRENQHQCYLQDTQINNFNKFFWA